MRHWEPIRNGNPQLYPRLAESETVEPSQFVFLTSPAGDDGYDLEFDPLPLVLHLGCIEELAGPCLKPISAWVSPQTF